MMCVTAITVPASISKLKHSFHPDYSKSILFKNLFNGSQENILVSIEAKN